MALVRELNLSTRQALIELLKQRKLQRKCGKYFLAYNLLFRNFQIYIVLKRVQKLFNFGTLRAASAHQEGIILQNPKTSEEKHLIIYVKQKNTQTQGIKQNVTD